MTYRTGDYIQLKKTAVRTFQTGIVLETGPDTLLVEHPNGARDVYYKRDVFARY